REITILEHEKECDNISVIQTIPMDVIRQWRSEDEPNQQEDQSWSSAPPSHYNLKPDIDEIDIDDLYNNLRVYEDVLKSGDFGVSTAGGINQVPSTPCAHDVAYSFLAQPTTSSSNFENEECSGRYGMEMTWRNWIFDGM
ncbi:hypothetical protein Tco_0024100, partial [Tanacetum coccineum]